MKKFSRKDFVKNIGIGVTALFFSNICFSKNESYSLAPIPLTDKERIRLFEIKNMEATACYIKMIESAQNDEEFRRCGVEFNKIISEKQRIYLELPEYYINSNYCQENEYFRTTLRTYLESEGYYFTNQVS